MQGLRYGRFIVAAVLYLVGFALIGQSTAARLATCPAPTSDPYARAVLADGPTVYYRLDEPSGSTMCDSSAPANNGVFNAGGLTRAVDGALSNSADAAVAADGTPGVIGTSSSPTTISGDHGFTLEGWFSSTGTVQNQALVAIGQGGNGRVAGLTIWPTGGGCAANGSSIGLDEYGVSNCWDTTAVGVHLFDGHWHYLAVTYDPTAHQVTGYVDASNLGAQTPHSRNASFNLTASIVRVGNWGDTFLNQPFIGTADEVAVYPTALAPARIAAHHAAALVKPPKSTLKAASPRIAVRKGKKARAGTITLIARCNQNAAGVLKGTITERLGRKHVRLVRLSTVHTALKAGVAKKVKVSVPAAVVLALKRGASESAAFTLTAKNANGTTSAKALIGSLRL